MLLGHTAYDAPGREIVFNAAFCAYFLHTVNASHILPLPQSWMTGDLAFLRLLIIGLVQLLVALLWDRLGGNNGSKRVSRNVRIVVLLAVVLENVHLLQSVFSSDPVSDSRRIYLVWNFIEVELLGMYLFFESYYAQREELLRQQELMQRERELWEAKAEQNREIRRIAHDLRHQIAMIEAMDSDAATGFAQALNRQIEEYLPLPDSGNVLLDAVLNEKARTCRDDAIRLQIEENIVSAEWIDPLDLSIIFGNAIENAIEAVRLLPEEERWIRVKLHETEMLFAAKIENPYTGALARENETLKSTKPQPLAHGIGIPSIRKTVGKYNGSVKIETENHLFILSLALMKPET